MMTIYLSMLKLPFTLDPMITSRGQVYGLRITGWCFEALRFRVQGMGLRVYSLEFRVKGVGCRASG